MHQLYYLQRNGDNEVKKPTLAKAKQMIKKANPGVKNLVVSWSHKPNLCDMRGCAGKFWSAVVNVSADGYRNKKMVISVDNQGAMIK